MVRLRQESAREAACRFATVRRVSARWRLPRGALPLTFVTEGNADKGKGAQDAQTDCRRARLVGPHRMRLLMATALMPVVVLVACSGQPRQQQAAAKSPDELYAAMEQSLTRYRDGVEALRRGEPENGRALITGAAAELAAGGDACVATPGCEPQRFMAAYGNLLVLRGAVLTNAAEGFAEIEPRRQGEVAMLADDVPEAQRSVNLLHGHDLAKVIKINGPVKAALHDWLTWMRPNLIDAYENSNTCVT